MIILLKYPKDVIANTFIHINKNFSIYLICTFYYGSMDSVKDYFFLQFSGEEFKINPSEIASFSTLSFGW